eukprot:TRINITY_DN13042_c0_g2_i1.p1 TRINITY_DN13042_c0_g2~~TRINITY_DN13042_c0_g2_i1.p1  ORF type:complete len:1425 (+),score=395.50 TRINITY_DN13042_c0_g2_i1:2961-7235(+)
MEGHYCGPPGRANTRPNRGYRTQTDLNSYLATLRYMPNQNTYGDYDLRTTLVDSRQESENRTVRITVQPVNEVPTLDLIAGKIIDEDTALTLTGTSISDVDIQFQDLMMEINVSTSLGLVGLPKLQSSSNYTHLILQESVGGGCRPVNQTVQVLVKQPNSTCSMRNTSYVQLDANVTCTTANVNYYIAVSQVANTCQSCYPDPANSSECIKDAAWVTQIGTKQSDTAVNEGKHIFVDSDLNSYILGYTYSALPGFSNLGSSDAILIKYNRKGAVVWTRQFGTASSDFPYSVVGDNAGSVFVSIAVAVAMDGQTAVGGLDFAVVRFSSTTGERVWTTQWGSTATDIAYGLAASTDGYVYVTGTTAGSFDGKPHLGSNDIALSELHAANGSIVWSVQLGGAEEDDATDVVIDSQNQPIVVGHTTTTTFDGLTNAGNYDIFVVKFHVNGTRQWSSLKGTTATDNAFSAVVGSDDAIYVLGRTLGALGDANLGGYDSVLVKMNAQGAFQWSKQFGSTAQDNPFGLGIDGNDNVFALAYAATTYDGVAPIGGDDGFVTHFVANGTKVGTSVYGTTSNDRYLDIHAACNGFVYLMGYTAGSMTGNTNQGSDDLFVQTAQVSVATVTNTNTRLVQQCTGCASCYVDHTTSDITGCQTDQPWVSQIGTHLAETLGPDGTFIYTDSDTNIYVLSVTAGAYPGFVNLGGLDAVLTKYHRSGSILWIQQFGTNGTDTPYAVTGDANGDLYVTLAVSTSMDGQSYLGSTDFAVVKFNSLGQKQWTSQLGSSATDTPYGIAADTQGFVYVVGTTVGSFAGQPALGGNDIVLCKLRTSDGTLMWTIQHGGTGSDIARGVAVDSNNDVVLIGQTTTSPFDGITGAGGTDIVIIKYTSAGFRRWTVIRGTSSTDDGHAIAIGTDDSIVVLARTLGVLGATQHGSYDSVIIKYSAQGVQQWIHQIGSSVIDYPVSISMDGADNVFALAYSSGVYDGQTSPGGVSGFLTQFSSAGAKVATTAFGTTSNDYYVGVATNCNGFATMVGYGSGVFAGHSNQGSTDVFVQTVQYRQTSTVTQVNTTVESCVGFPMCASCHKPNADDLVCTADEPWVAQYGTSANDGMSTEGKHIFVDAWMDIYTLSYTWGANPGFDNAGSSDVVVMKHHRNGSRLWLQQFGSSGADTPYSIAGDSNGNVYVALSTGGSLHEKQYLGAIDFALVKLSGTTGSIMWTQQWGSTTNDLPYSLAVTKDSNTVYVVGSTDGSVAGLVNQGSNDLVVSKLNALTGAIVWNVQYGSSGSEEALRCVMDSGGHLVVVGHTTSTTCRHVCVQIIQMDTVFGVPSSAVRQTTTHSALQLTAPMPSMSLAKRWERCREPIWVDSTQLSLSTTVSARSSGQNSSVVPAPITLMISLWTEKIAFLCSHNQAQLTMASPQTVASMDSSQN